MEKPTFRSSFRAKGNGWWCFHLVPCISFGWCHHPHREKWVTIGWLWWSVNVTIQ